MAWKKDFPIPLKWDDPVLLERDWWLTDEVPEKVPEYQGLFRIVLSDSDGERYSIAAYRPTIAAMIRCGNPFRFGTQLGKKGKTILVPTKVQEKLVKKK